MPNLYNNRELASYAVTERCRIIAVILDENKETTFSIDTKEKPEQKSFVGMKVGDCFKMHGVALTYKIKKIILM